MRPVTKITIAGMRLAVVVLAVYWCMMAIGTHLPAALDFSPRVNDKLKHFGAFAVLTLLMCYVTNADDWSLRQADRVGRSDAFRRQAVRFGLIAVVVLVYAAADEWTQQFVPRRVPDLHDFFADAVGMIFGLAIYVSAKLAFGKQIRERFYPNG